MARCGIYVDRLYSQSESVSKINAQARGTDAVPCVKVKWPRATIHWFLTKEGNLRIDGNSNAKDIVLDMLRKAFPPYVAGGKFRGSRAGRQAGGLHVALSQRRNREEI